MPMPIPPLATLLMGDWLVDCSDMADLEDGSNDVGAVEMVFDRVVVEVRGSVLVPPVPQLDLRPGP